MLDNNKNSIVNKENHTKKALGIAAGAVFAIALGATVPLISNHQFNIHSLLDNKFKLIENSPGYGQKSSDSYLPKRQVALDTSSLNNNKTNNNAEGLVLAESNTNPFLSSSEPIKRPSTFSYLDFAILGKYQDKVESFVNKYAKNGVALLLEKAEVIFFEDVTFKKKGLFKDEVTFDSDVKVQKDLNVKGDIKMDGTLEVDGDLAVDGMVGLKSEESNPSSGKKGQMYFNNTNNQIYVYNGSSWQQVGSTYTVDANGGLQLVNSQFGLVSCSDNQILKYISGVWTCSVDSGGVGSDTFLSLTDTPNSFSGQAGRFVRVGSGASSLEFYDPSGWDQNASDDITNSNYAAILDSVYLNTGESASGGDVTGPFSNLQLGTAVVGSNELASSGVTAGSYGSSSSIPVFTVDADGRLTSASSVGISNVFASVYLQIANNLSDLGNTASARSNLGLGTLSTLNSVDISSNTNLGGTSNRITINGDNIDISNSYAGQTSITTLGTINTGTWNGSVITVPFGGIGVSTLLANGLLYGNGTGPVQTVGVGTSGQVLTINGSSQPVWASAASIFNPAGSFLQISNNLNDLGNTANARTNLGLGTLATLNSVDISANTNLGGTTNRIVITGDNVDISSSYSGQDTITTLGTITSGTWNASVINVPYGGTGASTLATNGVLYGNGTGPVQTVGVGTSGQVLTINGSSQPIWASAASIFNPAGSFLQISNNLSDLGNTANARTNLGLGSLALLNSIDISDNTNLTGTSNRIAVTGDSVDIANNYAGQSSINTVGNITSGSWNGSVIQVPFGGTGTSTLTANGIVYGNGTGPVQTVGVGLSGQILTVNGSSQPVWVDSSTLLGSSSTANLWAMNGNNANANSFLGTTNTAPLYIGTSGLQRLTILANGNVGIANTNPTSQFVVSGNVVVDRAGSTSGLNRSLRVGGAQASGVDGYQSTIDLYNYDDNGSIVNDYLSARIGAHTPFDGYQDSGELWFETANDNVSGPKAVITRQGRFGIGTTNPLFTLQIGGTGSIYATGNFGDSFTIPAAAQSAGSKFMWLPQRASVVAGYYTTLADNQIGNYSAMFGQNTRASGQSSMAWGNASVASREYATSFGVGTTASGLGSLSFGLNTLASGTAATAWGSYAVASGDYATSWGGGYSTGINSTSWGNGTADGELSTAWGLLTVASGQDATSWGNNAVATGNDSTAWGVGTSANGFDSTAWGNGSIATGNLSTVFGLQTSAGSYDEAVLGAYNVNLSGDASNWVSTDPLFVIGNGLSTTDPSNAITLLKNGNLGIGNTNPTNMFTVGANNNFAVTSTGVITSGSWNGAAITVPFGGTGLSTIASNGLIYGNGTGPVSTVGVGVSGQILTVNGSSQPVWVDANTLVGSSSTANLWVYGGNLNTTVANILGTADTAPLYIGTSAQHRLTIAGNGYVGVGTTNPTEKLNIAGGTLLVDNPTISVSNSIPVTGNANDIAVQGKFAYIATGTGFAIYDVSSTTPIFISSTNPGPETSLAVSGKYLYTHASPTTVISIFNISNMTAPQLVGSISGVAGLANIEVVGNYAYLLTGSTGLVIYDVSKPTNPTLLSSISLGGVAGVDLKVVGKYAYVVASTYGFAAIDISDAKNPILAGTYANSVAQGLDIDGSYAYVADSSSGLEILNIANPSNIILSGTYQSNAVDVKVAGKYAYLLRTAGLIALDISNPATPISVSSVSIGGRYMRLFGNKALVAATSGGLKTYTLSGANISTLTTGNVLSKSVDITDNLVVGNNALLGNGLNVGRGGIMSQGEVSIINTGGTSSTNALTIQSGSSNGALLNIQTTSSANNILDAQSNGISRLYIRADGRIGIGNTNTSDLTGLLSVGSGATAPFNVNANGEVNLSGTGRHLKFITLSAEYPGAVLTNLYGAATEPNINGTMTSDLTIAGTGLTVPMSYYEWTSSQSTTQAYVVSLRVTLPQDFDSWNNDGSDDLTINYMTTDGTVGNNNISYRIIGPGGTANQYTSSQIASSTWTTSTVDSASFGASGNTGWDAAGETAVIYLRLEAKSTNVVRVGDIQLKYKSKW